MRLTPSQIERFHDHGYLVLPGLFTAQEIALLRAALPAIYKDDIPANIREKRSGEVRTAMGSVMERGLAPKVDLDYLASACIARCTATSELEQAVSRETLGPFRL